MARSRHSPAARHGVKWIRPATRFAIYYRDQWRCVYCTAPAPLTIDHYVPTVSGGSNVPSNLLTACHACNSARRDLSMRAWLKVLRARGMDTTQVKHRVYRQRHKPLDRAVGRRLTQWKKNPLDAARLVG